MDRGLAFMKHFLNLFLLHPVPFQAYSQQRFRNLCWVVNEDVGHRADEFAVLDNGAARHECVKVDTTHFLSDFQPIFA